MPARIKKLRFSLRLFLLTIGLIAIALTGIRYFAFPPPLTIQIEPTAALSVPVEGAFSVNGKTLRQIRSVNGSRIMQLQPSGDSVMVE